MTGGDQPPTRKEFDELRATVKNIVRELHGVESSADPSVREGGIVEDIRFIRKRIENGVKRSWDKTSVAVAGFVITASSTVIVGVTVALLRL